MLQFRFNIHNLTMHNSLWPKKVTCLGLNWCSFHDIEKVKSYDPLLMSLLKSTSNQCRGRGGDRLNMDFSALRHGLCMCVIQRVNGQDNRFKCL